MNNNMVGEIALAKAHALGSVALNKRARFLNVDALKRAKDNARDTGWVGPYRSIAPIAEAREARLTARKVARKYRAGEVDFDASNLAGIRAMEADNRRRKKFNPVADARAARLTARAYAKDYREGKGSFAASNLAAIRSMEADNRLRDWRKVRDVWGNEYQ